MFNMGRRPCTKREGNTREKRERGNGERRGQFRTGDLSAVDSVRKPVTEGVKIG